MYIASFLIPSFLTSCFSTPPFNSTHWGAHALHTQGACIFNLDHTRFTCEMCYTCTLQTCTCTSQNVLYTYCSLRLTGTVHVHRYSVHVHGLQMSVIQDLTIIPYYKHHRYIEPVLSLGAKSVDDRRARTRE